jgi:hypothetical protein
MITTEIGEEFYGMNQRMQTQKVQESYNTSKSIEMKRYVDKLQSPPCQIEIEAIKAHFSET